MRIRDIKDKALRELALKREQRLEQGLKDIQSQLIDGGMKEDSLIILSIKHLIEC